MYIYICIYKSIYFVKYVFFCHIVVFNNTIRNGKENIVYSQTPKSAENLKY